MDSKTKYGLAAALIGAFVLGGVTVVTYSTAQPAASGGAATAPAPAPQRGAQGAAFGEREPVDTSFSDLQEDEIRALVYDYLLTNPEVIVEAINEYQRRAQFFAQERAIEGARNNLDRLLDPKHGYVTGAGPDKAKIAVVELFDYHCGFCKRAAPLIKSMMDNEDDIKVVFREYPIFGEKSDYAAEIALSARDQDKFLEMHFAMMEASGDMTPDRVKKIARENGVNFAKLELGRDNPDIAAAIIETHEIVRAMGVDGTPAFVVASLEGDYVNVVQGFDAQALIESIEAARAAK